ncbi:MAG: glycosyltransferase family 4 protein, partial [Verrucomicrobiota bacterium]
LMLQSRGLAALVPPKQLTLTFSRSFCGLATLSLLVTSKRMPRFFSISATNPCHLYDVAKELNLRGYLNTYYSGYPRWKLREPETMTIQTHSWRTLVVYGLLKTIPERYRFSNRSLFRWQDEAFDLAVSKNLCDKTSFVAVPGQALHSFRCAKQKGATTILSHATGPLETWITLVREEFKKAGIPFSSHAPVDEETVQQHRKEYAEADWHWAPSRIVQSQLIAVGIPSEKIQVIPFGADSQIFTKSNMTPTAKPKRILFAGQLTWRKGLRLLDRVIPLLPREIEIECAGPFLEESREWVHCWSQDPRVSFLGPLSAVQLAQKMKEARILILPSVEESFGLVVPQALACGTPCLVSDCVGAQDLIEPGINGEVIPSDSEEKWASAILKWIENPRQVEGRYDWKKTADLFLKVF